MHVLIARICAKQASRHRIREEILLFGDHINEIYNSLDLHNPPISIVDLTLTLTLINTLSSV